MKCTSRRLAIAAVLTFGLAAAPAEAGLMLSKVILDLSPDSVPRDDIELVNDGSERLYVVAEPSEIVGPGMPTEARRSAADPAQSGLLVTPQKLILEPGEHKLVRVAAIAARPAHDRVYRVTIKPVAGPVTADQSALKLYIGYDVLVLYRPEQPKAEISALRSGNRLTLTNNGNTNIELAQGHQCDATGSNCRDLPANRLYPGQAWTVDTPYRTPASWRSYGVGDQAKVQF